jgi:hypothetical protein
VRDPPGEEEGRRRAREVEGIEARGREVVARMVEGHDHHDETPQDVDRIDAASSRDGTGELGGGGRQGHSFVGCCGSIGRFLGAPGFGESSSAVT